MTYRTKRYINYALITIFVIALPFIQINGKQIFLLSFDKKELHLFGALFNTQEFFVMPFLLILLFVGIFFITTLLGRFWCGWACPQTIFRVIYRDLIEGKILGLNKISNKQTAQNLSSLPAKLKKSLSFVLIGLCCYSASAVLLFYFVPPYDFWAYLCNPSEHLILLGFWLSLGIFFTLDIVFFKENFCIYVCPYSRVQSVLYDEDTQTVIYDTKRGGAIYNPQGEKFLSPLKSRTPQAECIECQKCVRVCPTHIDIRAGMQLECINCLECVDACQSVMFKLHQPSLVQWSSNEALKTHSKVRYFRPKTIGYLLILCSCLAMAVFMGSKKEDLSLNINRQSASLYSIHNQKIENEYIVLIENLTDTVQTLHLQVNHPNLKLLSPTKDFTLQPREKRKMVLVLQYQGNSQVKESSLPFILKVSSLTNPQIFTERKSVFIYQETSKEK